jgi:hypothetical protein
MLEEHENLPCLLTVSACRDVVADVEHIKLKQHLSNTDGVSQLLAKVSAELATRGAYVTYAEMDRATPVIRIKGVNDAYGRDVFLRRVTLFNDTDAELRVYDRGEGEYELVFPVHYARLERSLELLTHTELLDAARKFRKHFRVQLGATNRARNAQHEARDLMYEMQAKLTTAEERIEELTRLLDVDMPGADQ